MTSDKNTVSPEMAVFNEALRGVLQVSKSDLARMLADEKITHSVKQRAGRKPKASASAHASPDRD
jgi:hypothetical protein